MALFTRGHGRTSPEATALSPDLDHTSCHLMSLRNAAHGTRDVTLTQLPIFQMLSAAISIPYAATLGHYQ